MTTMNEVFKEQKKSLDKKIKTYIRNSERTGNSYDKEHFDLYVQDIICSGLEKDKPTLSEDDYYVVANTLYNHARIDLVPAYEDSFRTHPRAINNKQAHEVTDDWYAEAKKQLKIVRSGIRNRTKEVLQQSEASGKTPTLHQFTSYMTGQLMNVTSEMPEDLADFVRAYTQGWIEKTGADFYHNSLRRHPREVTNDFPWSRPKEDDSSRKTDNDKLTLKSILNAPMSVYGKTYKSFSGHDMVCTIDIPMPNGESLSKVIGALQTVTYSIHDEKTPVRCLGDMNAKGYVFGPRTIAGTLIFSVFDRHWMHDIMKEYLAKKQVVAHFLADELPPFNMKISCANEYGNKARLAIYGITLVNEGQVMSINDVYTENTYQFFAMDVDYLTDVTNKGGNTTKKTENLPVAHGTKTTTHVVYLNDADSEQTPADPSENRPSTDPSKDEVMEKRHQQEPPSGKDSSSNTPYANAKNKTHAKMLLERGKTSSDAAARQLLNDGEISEEECSRRLSKNRLEYEKHLNEIEDYFAKKEGVPA